MHFHRWTKWETTFDGRGEGTFVGQVRVIYQERHCEKCGKRQLNKIVR